MSISPPDGTDSMRDRVDRLLEVLGYSDDPDFIVPGQTIAVHLRHSLDMAFGSMGTLGALCVRSHLADGRETATPVVYVVQAADANEANAHHRAIWSQSLVPLVLIATPDHIQLRNGFDYRGERLPAIAWSEISSGLPEALALLRSKSIRSATAWRDFAITSQGRIDNRLHKDIQTLSDWTRARDSRISQEANLINSLIGRFIYLYVLVDRGVLGQTWIDGLLQDGKPACPDIRLQDHDSRATWPASQVWILFDAIDGILNGSIFPMGQKRHLISDDTIEIVRRVLRSDRIEGGAQQLGFIDVDYASIRTETISIIYELFFELEEGSSKKEDGAFYTPPFLVDYVLDEVDGIRSFDSRSRVFDPAAGSGAFLVGSYRRIVESEISRNKHPTATTLRAILLRCMWGMEINEQAANVARFSLYLTMLDYLPGASLQKLSRITRSVKLFPPMDDNIVTGDTFDALPDGMTSSVTHIVGNPPWAGATKDSPAAKYCETLPTNRPVARGNLAELFFWRCVDDIIADDGIVALVMPTKSFVAPKAKHFPSAMFSTVRVHGITNLAHLRRQLFAGAEDPATVIFASKTSPTSLDWTWRYSPILANQPLSNDGHPWAIVIDRGNVERTRQIDLAESRALHRELMLQPIDRRLASEMETRANLGLEATTFGNFAARAQLILRRGGSPAETGIAKTYLLDTKSNDYLERLGLRPGSQHNYELPLAILKEMPSIYQQMFAGPTLLVPRSQSQYHVVNHPVGFASTLFGIAFGNGGLPAVTKLEVLTEIAAFLESAVARYLLSLFGRMWVLDHRRFETTDLLTLPFPYLSVADLLDNKPSKMTQEDLVEFFEDRLDLTPTFRSIVWEHHNLRAAFENGRVPPASISLPVEEPAVRGYIEALTTNFDRLIGDAGRLRVLDRRIHNAQVHMTLEVRRDDTMTAPNITWPDFIPDFGEQSSIRVMTRTPSPIVAFAKSTAAGAWTMERAYLDAENLARSVISRAK